DDVAGDLFDWFMADDGTLVFTVADVMGKGIAASLMMASLRAALRAAATGLGPAARMALAQRSMAPHAGDECLFVTAFHGQLDLVSRELRYVDAGHGYCQIRGSAGELRELGQRSLPLGVELDQTYQEGSVRLQPGEALIVHSDGLVESDGETSKLSSFSEELDASLNARDMVRRLLGRMPFSLPDDVTVLVLRCLAPVGTPDCDRSELVTTGGGGHGAG
ncbi:MAG: serine/threonine-protein phosphatase, partial [Candidatus Dormibacteraeota bacterium]|nr:serine/threonine-protein phosphatase [Candidatus Dormibacteraeota bacterium]